jgi:hypothetical protein
VNENLAADSRKMRTLIFFSICVYLRKSAAKFSSQHLGERSTKFWNPENPENPCPILWNPCQSVQSVIRSLSAFPRVNYPKSPKWCTLSLVVPPQDHSSSSAG